MTPNHYDILFAVILLCYPLLVLLLYMAVVYMRQAARSLESLCRHAAFLNDNLHALQESAAKLASDYEFYESEKRAERMRQ